MMKIMMENNTRKMLMLGVLMIANFASATKEYIGDYTLKNESTFTIQWLLTDDQRIERREMGEWNSRLLLLDTQMFSTWEEVQRDIYSLNRGKRLGSNTNPKTVFETVQAKLLGKSDKKQSNVITTKKDDLTSDISGSSDETRLHYERSGVYAFEWVLTKDRTIERREKNMRRFPMPGSIKTKKIQTVEKLEEDVLRLFVGGYSHDCPSTHTSKKEYAKTIIEAIKKSLKQNTKYSESDDIRRSIDKFLGKSDTKQTTATTKGDVGSSTPKPVTKQVTKSVSTDSKLEKSAKTITKETEGKIELAKVEDGCNTYRWLVDEDNKIKRQRYLTKKGASAVNQTRTYDKLDELRKFVTPMFSLKKEKAIILKSVEKGINDLAEKCSGARKERLNKFLRNSPNRRRLAVLERLLKEIENAK